MEKAAADLTPAPCVACCDVQPITEYLSAEGLDYFLSTPPSRRTKVGMLQTFIHPKGTSNFIIRVSWTPEECTMNSCININRLADPDLEVQERAATNDEKHCVLIPMSGNVLAKQLERLCDTIAEHLHLASQQQYKVSSMVINFKIDNEDRVWLLWCEQLEVQDEMGNKLPRAVLAPEEDEPVPKDAPRRKGTGRRDESGVTFDDRSPGRSKSRRRSPPSEPEMVDDDDDDFFSAHASNMGESQRPSRPSTRKTEDDDDDEEEPYGDRGPTPFEHEEVDPSDFVILPEGQRERTAKSKKSSKSSRKPQPKAPPPDDSTPRSDVSGSDAPPPKRRGSTKEAKAKEEQVPCLRVRMQARWDSLY
eukprot:2806059-Rhodomonas_salina.3